MAGEWNLCWLQMSVESTAPRADNLASWIRQIARGDRDAFETLYRTFAPRLFGYLYRTVGDCAVAEELTNDVMFEVWKGAAGFRGESKPSTWIFGIAHHKALNALRGKRPQHVELETAGQMADPSETPEEVSSRQERSQNVRAALARLSPEHREVIELTFTQGLHYQEIAQIVNCPVNTVKTRMFHAKEKLQQFLAEAGTARELA